MALIKCIECGNEISNKAEVCPNCGCPVSETVKEKNNKKKKMLIIKRYNTKTGYYNNLKWGITSERLEKKLKDVEKGSKDNCYIQTQSDYEGITGLSAAIFYYWDDNNKFNQVAILLTYKGTELSNKVMLEKYVSQYDDRYGEHECSNSYTYEWETSKTKIELINVTGNVVSVKIYDKNNPKEDDK